MLSRDFGLYLASRFCTATAMMMMRAAIAWHVFALSHSAFHLGLIGLAQFVPVLSFITAAPVRGTGRLRANALWTAPWPGAPSSAGPQRSGR